MSSSRVAGARHFRLTPDVSVADHSLGAPCAHVTLVEYGDYECPFCYRAQPIVMAVRAKFGEKLRFVFRNFPLTAIHRNAMPAAEAAESVAVHAGDAAFWRMHDAIFEHQQDARDALDEAHLLEYARGSGADGHLVQTDLAKHVHVERIRTDFAGGVRSGVNGTPAFFINGERFDGDWTRTQALVSAIEAAMLVAYA